MYNDTINHYITRSIIMHLENKNQLFPINPLKDVNPEASRTYCYHWREVEGCEHF